MNIRMNLLIAGERKITFVRLCYRIKFDRVIFKDIFNIVLDKSTQKKTILVPLAEKMSQSKFFIKGTIACIVLLRLYEVDFQRKN
jgi:hypothetical protein